MPRKSLVNWETEDQLRRQGYALIAGIDEAGRGCLAGPVVAAAVVFPAHTAIANLDDSKRLSRPMRQAIYQQIIQHAIGVGVGYCSAEVIDRVNIRQGTLLAMWDAVGGLAWSPHYLLIDGHDRLPMSALQRSIVGGDATVGSIAAAAIIAKETRDRLMEQLDLQHPGYGFAQHKGYGTAAHLRALQRLGPCAVHRRSFRGVTCVAEADG
jgi:ribonuclease HII